LNKPAYKLIGIIACSLLLLPSNLLSSESVPPLGLLKLAPFFGKLISSSLPGVDHVLQISRRAKTLCCDKLGR
jgi:hypothetical protein